MLYKYLRIENSDEYHFTTFYDKTVDYKGILNSRPYFEFTSDTDLIRISWSLWGGRDAWIIYGASGGEQWERFITWSDVDHPKDAELWYYLPSSSNTEIGDMVPATNLIISVE